MGPRQNPRRFGRRSKQGSSACRSDGQVYLGIWRCGMTWLRPRKTKRDAILGLVASWGDRRTPRRSLQRNPSALSMRLVGFSSCRVRRRNLVELTSARHIFAARVCKQCLPGNQPMHSHSLDPWTHDHVFLGPKHDRNERRTWFVVALTAVMMVGEIAAGSLFGSMALLADGWHMGTHPWAPGVGAAAYLFARQHARNSRFAFGTGKFGDLAAFSSAIILSLIAVQIFYESVIRLVHPVAIAYGEAIAVAALGLGVNLVSAWLLRDSHDHDHHGHGHSHGSSQGSSHDSSPGHRHHDNNLRAAYIHVLADAATSVLAIAALVIAMYSQWVWADPAVGIIGSLVIASWAFGLIRDSGAVLLDVSVDKNLEAVIRDRLETRGDRVIDLHLWQVGPGHRAAVIAVLSDDPLPSATYKRRLGGLRGLSHVTIEVEVCPHAPLAAEHPS